MLDCNTAREIYSDLSDVIFKLQCDDMRESVIDNSKEIATLREIMATLAENYGFYTLDDDEYIDE